VELAAPFRYGGLVDVAPTGGGRPRRAELLAALSLAIDLGLGQPLEPMLRSCLIAMKLADLVGADTVERDTAYYGVREALTVGRPIDLAAHPDNVPARVH